MHIRKATLQDAEAIARVHVDSWKRETNTVPHSSDLASIYILESYQGRSIGKQLLQSLFNIFKQLGWQKVCVEVLENNKICEWYKYYVRQ